MPHTKNQLSTLKNKKVGKPVQNARCALVLDTVQTASKKEAYAENFNIIGRKLKKRWQISFRACLPVIPFKNLI